MAKIGFYTCPDCGKQFRSETSHKACKGRAVKKPVKENDDIQWTPGMFVFFDGHLEWYIYRVHPMSYDIWAPMTGQIQYHLSHDTIDLLSSEVPQEGPIKEEIDDASRKFWDEMEAHCENIIDDAKKFHPEIWEEALQFVDSSAETPELEPGQDGYVGGYELSSLRVEYLMGRLRSYYPNYSDREWSEITSFAKEILMDEMLP